MLRVRLVPQAPRVQQGQVGKTQLSRDQRDQQGPPGKTQQLLDLLDLQAPPDLRALTVM